MRRTCIGNHRPPFGCRDAARVEIRRNGTARCAASLDATLDWGAQCLGSVLAAAKARGINRKGEPLVLGA
jgi:hypothetical protein